MSKKLVAVMAALALALSMTACGDTGSAESAENIEPPVIQDDNVDVRENEAQPSGHEQDAAASDTEAEDSGSEADAGKGAGTLVVVFSATGTTKGVAEKIAAIEGADIYEIIPAEPYSDADLDWSDKTSRTTIEQDDPSLRPAIGSGKLDLSGYTKVYIGYPIWWGEEPRIMDTFVESYDFGNITMIPFCTSGGSGIGRSGKNLAENARSGNWIDGDRLNGNISEEELKDWIEGLK